jgi:zinc protease
MIRTLKACASAALLSLAACATAPAPQPEASAPPTAEATAPAPAPRLFDLPYTQRELPNGLVAIAVKTPFKGMVSLQIPVQTGSRNEVEPGKTGFAHFFEHMMFRGTPSNPPEVYGAAMQRAGADQNAYTDDDLTNYYVNFTPADLDQVLALEADRFQNLSYSEEQFRTEALAVKGEYLKNYSNPLLKGFEALQGLAYTTHTYRHTTIGFFDDIERMPNQLDYSRTFFQRWYRPEKTSVIVAGDIDPEATIALIEKHFGSWQRGDFEAEIPVEPPQTEARYQHVAWSGPTLPWLISAWKAPAFDTSTPDSAALAVIAELRFGTASPLYQDLVVKRRLVDQFFAAPPLNRDPGLFVLAMRLTAPEHAPAVTRAIQDTLLELRSVPTDADSLVKTRSRLKYSFASGMNSAASVGGILARFVHYERSVETLNRYYATFEQVDSDAILAVADRVFADAQRTTVSIANGDSLAGADDFRALDAEIAPARLAAAAAQSTASGTTEAPAAAPRRRQMLIDTEAAQRAWAANEAANTVPLVQQPSDSPLIDIALVLRAGSAYEPEGKRGLAALTAAMVANGGTTARSYDEITRAQYPYAATLEAQVDKEMVRFAATVHRDNAVAWWTIVAEQLFDPGFRDDDFARIKQQQLNAIRINLRANNDEEFGKEALYRIVYGPGHPYGALTLGHVRELEAITLDDVRAFYRDNYLRSRVLVGLAGGYDQVFRETVHGSTMRWQWMTREQRLGVAPALARHVPRPEIAPATARRTRQALVIDKDSSNSVAVSFGFPLEIDRTHADWPALWLVRSWLGEHRNSNGRLYQRIREQRGLNYGNYAYVEYFPNGMFLMQPEPNYVRQHDLFQVWIRPLRDNNDALFATRAALFELEHLIRDGMSAEAFEQSRAFLLKFSGAMTSVQARALGYGIDARFLELPEFTEFVRARLSGLTLEQVNAAIKRHLRTDGIRFVFISADGEGLAAALATNKASPIRYNTDKPAELLAEDRRIERWPLKLARRDVEVIAADKVFD